MIIAATQHMLIQASDAQRGGKYYCPACNAKLVFRHGEKKIAHFAHQRQSDCQTFSEGETTEHLKGKQQLHNWFRQAGYHTELEAYLPILHQRPDILVTDKNGQKLAVEFQCAPISSVRLRERTSGYWQHGYQVIWVLGKPYWNQGHPNRKALKFMQFAQQWGHFLAFWQTETRSLVVHGNLWQTDWQPLTYCTKTFNSGNWIWPTATQFQLQKQNTKISGTKRLDKQRIGLQRSLFWGQSITSELQKEFYQHHHNLVMMPDWLYDGYGSPPWSSQLVTNWRLATLLGWLKPEVDQLSDFELLKIMRITTKEYLLTNPPACLSRTHVQQQVRQLWQNLINDCQQHDYLIQKENYWQAKWGPDWPNT